MKEEHEEAVKNISGWTMYLTGTAFVVYVEVWAKVRFDKVFTISLLGILGGVLWESLRLRTSWRKLGIAFVAAFVLSLLPVAFSKYTTDKQLVIWLYAFLALFAGLVAWAIVDRVNNRLTENMTLMQSLSVLYWITDYHFWSSDLWWIKLLVIVSVCFAVFSIFNALTPFVLSRATRFVLSYWSAVAMVLISLDNIYWMYEHQEMATVSRLSAPQLIALQYFMLGASGLYIVQNLVLATVGLFFPAAHVERYSEHQAPFSHAISCIVVVGAAYWLNYHYHFLPRNLAIWTVFVVFPPVFALVTKDRRRRTFQ